jgi:glycosyltransferase involved in cell wall biosynthesis
MSEAIRHILQVNTADISGGAEKVVMDLHARYLELGLDSWVAVGTKRSDSPRVLVIPNEASRSAWARSLEGAASAIEKRAGGVLGKLVSRPLLLAAEPARYTEMLRGVEDFAYPGTAGLLGLPPTRPDVLHLHNLHGYYFDIRQLPRLAVSQATVITLHDAWLLTGHCAHPFECPNWETGCGACPDLVSYVPISGDMSPKNWRIKHDAVRESGASIATPSSWLMRLVEASGIAGETALTRVIPNGVDVGTFTPGNRAEAKSELGLPRDRPVVLFAARNAAGNPFKDFPTLLAAMPLVAAQPGSSPLFVALGADAPVEAAGADVMSAPFEHDPARLALWYRAADVYVHPTRAESFGLTIAEAMACGTPVVASRVGAVPELIVEGESGLLVDVGEPQGLAIAVSGLLGDAARRQSIGEAGVARIREHFTLERQADAYLAYYAEIAETRG